MTKVLLLAILFSNLAIANAMPTVLAKTIHSGGLPMPGCGSRETTIYSDGRVVSSKCGQSEVVELTLGKAKTQYLKQLGDQSGAGSGVLAPLHPKEPMCADGPDVRLSLATPKGMLVVGAFVACREHVLQWSDHGMHPEAVALGLIKAVNEIVDTPFIP